YYGLPFAQPPIGDLRWRAPVPIESGPKSVDIINATAPGFQCMQGGTAWQPAVVPTTGQPTGGGLGFPGTSTPLVTNEDCLRLDVFVPNKPKSSSLPVIFAIHGGGYTGGNSAGFPGETFVKWSEGSVVFVSIQYRLGALGFLGGSGITSDGTANVGLLDQRLALQWVQKHIAAFGGDPAKVTMWGQSAGAGSITEQLIMYGGEAKPPFRAAIAEWPGVLPHKSNQALERQYQHFLDAGNCKDLACLRKINLKDLDTVIQKAANVSYSRGEHGYGDFWWSPYVDGKIIPDISSKALARGAFSKVPLLTSRNSFEGTFFADPNVTTEAGIRKNFAALFQLPANDPLPEEVLKQYPLASFSGSYFNHPFFTAIGDCFIVCPTSYLNIAASKANSPNWKLNFDASIYLHGATALYTLGDSALTPSAVTAQLLKSYYLAFVVNMDPNAEAGAPYALRPQWSQYGTDSKVLQIDDLWVNTKTDTMVTVLAVNGGLRRWIK
ncbi:alpha/beta-hydrolase, partial [Pyrenochaeta sp. DS3sAY3a]